VLWRVPPPSADERRQLLDWIEGEAGPEGLQQLLLEGNSNKAIPLFTACHSCVLPAIQWLVERKLITWPMLQAETKKGTCCQCLGRGGVWVRG